MWVLLNCWRHNENAFRLAGCVVLASSLLVPAVAGQTATNSGSMSVAGYVEFRRGGSATPHPASYTMTNGQLRLQALAVRLATFHQSGGTNEIAENLWVTQGWHNDNTVYGLSGGYLITSNSTASASSTYYPGTRGFQQSGGTHIVRGTLFLQSGGLFPSGYSFFGGQLIVRDIHMLGAIFSHAGGSLTHTGTLILTGGHWKHGWSSAPQTQDFGMLQLKAARTNSTFTFSTGVSAIVRFAASAEMAWDPEARLGIQGWQAGSAGSRLHQIYFGTNRGGLTSGNFRKFGSGIHSASSRESIPQSTC